jgi:hypothetical protein
VGDKSKKDKVKHKQQQVEKTRQTDQRKQVASRPKTP